MILNHILGQHYFVVLLQAELYEQKPFIISVLVFVGRGGFGAFYFTFWNTKSDVQIFRLLANLVCQLQIVSETSKELINPLEMGC